MFVAVGPSGHFLIVSWSACALSNKGSWFPMFIFVDGWGFVLFLWSVVFVATQVVCPLFLNICNRGLFLGVRTCGNNSCVCVFESFLGALEVRNTRFV